MSQMFVMFNTVFAKMVNEYKPLYAIAWYDLTGFKGLTGIVADNYDEIKEVYDEKYSGGFGVTEYSYKIVKINMEDIKDERN